MATVYSDTKSLFKANLSAQLLYAYTRDVLEIPSAHTSYDFHFSDVGLFSLLNCHPKKYSPHGEIATFFVSISLLYIRSWRKTII